MKSPIGLAIAVFFHAGCSRRGRLAQTLDTRHLTPVGSACRGTNFRVMHAGMPIVAVWRDEARG